ncbi:MAG: transglutaminase-like domain-containing protein, partial [candidate division WOR-3 bacterium]
MKLQIDDLDTVNLDLEDDFQRIISKRPLIIEFVTPDLESIPEISAPGKVEMEFVKPSIYIQSEEPEIVRTAKNIAGIETDKKEVVQRLTNWIYVNLKKRPTVSMPSAVDVLKTMEGDCNEHAILFVAFARALGIPAKIYVGLVNLGNAYYYHAWCAVYLGKWVPVDPTFNQFPADAGHFKLKTGELSEQTKVLKVVGKLKIKVLAYR